MYRNVLLFVILSVSGLLRGFSQEVFTLEKALEVAFVNSPSLIQSRLGLQQSRLNLDAQRASLKSQFSLDVTPFSYNRRNQYDSYNSEWYDSKTLSSSASLGVTQPIKWTDGTISLVNDFSWQDASNQTSGGSKTSFSHDISLRLNQPIFTYNQTKMQLQELELSYENSTLSYAMQQLNIEKNVTQSFYDVYKSQMDLNIARDEFANQKQNYDIIKAQAEAKTIAEEELFQAEVNLASSESSLYSQEINYENVKDNFKLLLGLSLDEDILVLPDVSVSPINVNAQNAVKYGLEQRMELRQKEITLERDVFSIIRAKANNEFRGTISARVGLNALGEKVQNMYDNPTDNEQIGISLTIPIFDWGAKKARVESAMLAKEANEVDMNEQKKNIMLGIRQICRNLPNLTTQIEISRKKVKNAEMTYDINLERYRDGNISGMELQQYQSQLTSAKQAYTNAIISYKIELLNLKVQTLWDFESNKTYLPVDVLKTNNNKN